MARVRKGHVPSAPLACQGGRGVRAAVRDAEAVLPGMAATEGELDPRWQAIIEVGQFIEDKPEAVWAFARRWGEHEDEDLRVAVATVLLEHLLQHHFDLIFPRVRDAVRLGPRFAWTFAHCWKFGQSELPSNARQFDDLMRQVRTPRMRPRR